MDTFGPSNFITTGYTYGGSLTLEPQGPIEVNVAGWEKDEIEVTQDGQYVNVFMSTSEGDDTHGSNKRVYVGNNKVSKATYKAGMLTLHFEDTSSVIPIE